MTVAEKKNFLDDKNGYKTFKVKSDENKNLVNEAIYILEHLGIPISSKSPRLMEKMALALLSLGDMDFKKKWNELKDIDSMQRTTRQIIEHQNATYNEKRMSGSYDDVRREDLIDLVQSGIVLNTKPNASKNDPTRKYGISKEYAQVIRTYDSPDWERNLKKILNEKGSFSERVSARRKLQTVPIKISKGVSLQLSSGEHNILQKLIVEQFLPRFCPNGEILYLGDTAKKQLINKKEKLASLKFFELDHGILPDIVAYRKEKNWLYLVEAVHTANPITVNRKIQLEKLTENCKAGIIYVSAFMNRDKLRPWLSKLAWETEIWLAEDPDHLIHFDGHKFLGPYEK